VEAEVENSGLQEEAKGPENVEGEAAAGKGKQKYRSRFSDLSEIFILP
jgi:hypothetical protein